VPPVFVKLASQAPSFNFAAFAINPPDTVAIIQVVSKYSPALTPPPAMLSRSARHVLPKKIEVEKFLEARHWLLLGRRKTCLETGGDKKSG
jgi:hypothetical protein